MSDVAWDDSSPVQWDESPTLKDKMAASDAALSLPAGTTQRQLTVESGLNPAAYNKDSQAAGLAQVIPATQQALEARLGRKLDPYNEDDALLMHKAVMGENLQHFGNLGDALRAYNSGWSPSKWDNPETNNYVNKILPAPSVVWDTTPSSEVQWDNNGNPTWTEALKQTAKSMYEVPLAMGSGMVGGALGAVAGAVPAFLEQYGLVPKGTGTNISSAIQNALAFQPTSPVAQTAMQGMDQLNVQNIPDWTERKLAELAGQPAPDQTGVGHQLMGIANNAMLFSKPRGPQSLGELADIAGPPAPTPSVNGVAGRIEPSMGIPTQESTDLANLGAKLQSSADQNIKNLTDLINASKVRTNDLEQFVSGTNVLSQKPVPPAVDTTTPVKAVQSLQDIANAPVPELTQHLDTALRQVETGLVESNYKRVPIAVTNEQAAAMGYDPVKIMSKAFGEPLSAAEVQAVSNLSAAADAHILDIAQREMKGDPTLSPTDLGKAVAMKNTIMDYLQQGVGENARAMRQMQESAQSTTALEASVKSMADNFGDVTVRQKAAQAIINAAADPVTLAQTAKALSEPTVVSKINQIIVNSYLTSPLTHEVSLVSHGTMPLSYLADQTVSAVLGLADRGVAALLGKEPPNVTTFGELGANYKGLITGSIEGYKVYKKVWSTEALQALPSEANGRSFNAFGNSPMARLSNLPATEIMSHNQFFQAMVYRMALDGIAERDSWLSGLDPSSKAMLAENIRKSPTATQQAAAEATARDYSFSRNLGTIGQGISKISNNNPLIKANLPFIKIGINIGKQIVEHTPLALMSPRFYEDLRGSPLTRNAAIAKMMVGTAVLNQAWQAAQNGTITGSAPTDPALKAAWLALHPEKSYLGSDGQWHTHNQYGVASDLLNLGANLAQIHDQWQRTRLIEGTIGTPKDQITDKQMSQAALGLSSAMYEAMLNKTFFRTITNIVDTATANTENKIKSGIGNYAAGLLPASPLLSFSAKETDPILRRTTDSIVGPLQARFPWQSASMLPKISAITGEPLLKNNPLVPVPQTQDKAISEMVRLGVKLPLVPNHFTLNDGGDTMRPPMTPEENNYVTQFRGQNAKATVDKMVAMPNWDQLPDQNKTNLIKMVYDNFQKAGEQILTAKVAQENKERIILEVRRAMLNTTKGQTLLPAQLAP